MKEIEFYIGLDPGIQGGLTIIDKDNNVSVYKNPIKKTIINKKQKNVYDLEEFLKILFPYKGKALFLQEIVGVRPGEGGVSAFGFGKSAGYTIGLAVALEFIVIEISPIRWKKDYPDLKNDFIADKKEKIKEITESNKILKDIKSKKENKKLIDKLNREIKAEAKTAARALAGKLYPDVEEQFRKKNSDGLAESLLIALYGRNHKNELVQDL